MRSFKNESVNRIQITHIMAMIGIVIVGGVLRLRGLGTHDFWFDEVVIIHIASNLDNYITGDILYFAAPLFPILVRGWMFFGTSQVFLLLLPAFFGTISIVIMYFLGKELYDVKTGLFAAFLLALSPISIYYSQELKPYSLFVGMTMLSFYLYSLMVKRERASLQVYLLGMANGLLLYTHYFGVLVIVVEHMVMLYPFHKHSGSSRAIIVKLLKSDIIVLFMFFPWMFLVLSRDLLSIISYCATWISEWRLQSPLITMSRMFAGYHSPAKLSVIISAIYGMLLIRGMMEKWIHKEDRGSGFVVMLLVAGAIIPIVLTSVAAQWRNIFLDRYLVFVSGPLLVLVARGIAMYRKRNTQLFVTVLCAGVLIVPLAFVNLNRIPHEDAGIFMKKEIHKAVRCLKRSCQRGDLVINSSNSSICVINHYWGERIYQPFVVLDDAEFKRFESISPSVANYNPDFLPHFLPTTIIGHDRIWLIDTSWPTAINETGKIREWMTRYYIPATSAKFLGVEVILFLAREN